MLLLMKRGLALLLCLCLALGYLPGGMTVSAADDPQPKAPEQMTVDTQYPSVDRSQATITYHKEGIAGDGLNLLMLVDVSAAGDQSYAEFIRMMREQGVGYIFDHTTEHTYVRMLAYQNIINQDTGFLDSKDGFLMSFEDHDSSGSGNPNEVTVLSKATEIVQGISNGLPTVVLWVPGRIFGQPEAAVEAELQKLEAALGEEDALITWELAEQPRELLTQYASTYTVAHEPEKGELPAAFARADGDAFRADMATSLEQVVHDHYHNIRIPLSLKEDQTIATRIVDAKFKSASSQTDIEFTIAEDGQSIEVHIINLCRQSNIDVSLTVELASGVHELQDVIDGGLFAIPDDGSNGGLHSGIFDEDIVENLSIQIPTAQVDRRQYTVTYDVNGAGGAIQSVLRMPGELVAIPDGDDLTKDGENFSGWNVTSAGELQNRHLTAGEVIPMPQQNLTLEAAWGHLEVELEIAHTAGDRVYGNKMMEGVTITGYNNGNPVGYDEDFGPLDFYGVYDSDSWDGFKEIYGSDGKAIGNRIKSVVFDDEEVRVDRTPDPDDPLKVTLPDIPAVYAREIGATDDDLVVAYLIPWAEGAVDDLQLVITGPGGVTAPDDSTGLISGTFRTEQDPTFFAWSYNVQEIKLNDLLDVSGVTNMQQMFAYLPNLTSLDLGANFDTSNVTNMQQMFAGCPKLETLDLGDNFDTSNVTNMRAMFAARESFGEVVNDSEPSAEDSALTSLTLGNKFNTAKVENMYGMFRKNPNLENLDLGDQFFTSSVKNMSNMFKGCQSLKNLDLGGHFDTSAVTDMSHMFQFCRALNTQELAKNFDVSAVTAANKMFAQNDAVTEFDLSSWTNDGKVTRIGGMFEACDVLTKVTLGDGFSTRNVTGMGDMFQDNEMLTSVQLGSGFSTASCSDFSSMFYYCTKLAELDVSKWDMSKATHMQWMFYKCESLQRIDMGGLSCTPEYVDNMFGFMLAAKTIVPPDFDFQDKDISLANMFIGCTDLESLDLSGWTGLQNLTSTESMLSGCSSLTQVTFGGEWETSQFNKLATMKSMFWGCGSLENLDLGGWTLPNLTDVSGMFGSCKSLKTLDLSWKEFNPNSALLKYENFFANLNNNSNSMTVTVEDEDGNVDPDSAATLKLILKNGGGEQFTPSTIPVDFLDDAPTGTALSSVGPQTPEEPVQLQAPQQVKAVSWQGATTENGRESIKVLDTLDNTATRGNGVVEDNPEMVPVSTTMDRLKEPTAPDSTVTYRVTVKYVGDVGAKSGVIEMYYPLPEHMVQDPDIVTIEVSEIKDTGTPTGFMGGRIVTQPYLDTTDPTAPVLRGTFEGLFTGTEIEIDITCNNKEHSFNSDGFMFWDGTAYALGGNSSAVSKTIRLWYPNQTNPGTPDTPEYRVIYRFEGDLPAGVTLPQTKSHQEGDTVTAAASPLTPELEAMYTFTGWVKESDGSTVDPVDTFEMPGEDVTLVGTWKLKEDAVPKITVKYAYVGDVPPGAPTIGNTADDVIQSPRTYLVGKDHTIIEVPDIGRAYTFPGWIPSMTVKGNPVPLTTTDGGKTYQGTYNGNSFVINMADGVLFTQQFQPVATAAPEDVVVTFTGEWVVKEHDIAISVTGGTSDPTGTVTVLDGEDQKIQFTPKPGYVLESVTVDGVRDTLQPDGSYTFENVTKDHTIRVVYKPLGGVTHQITVSVTGGTADPTGIVTVTDGEDQKIQFTPTPGYVLESVTVDGVRDTLQPDGSYTFENVTKDHIIHVVYKPQGGGSGGGGSGGGGGGGGTTPSYTLSYESNGGTTYPDETYAKGTEVTISKIPVKEGYTFDGWYLDENLTQKVTQVTMNKDITVYAKWVKTDIPEDLNGGDHYAYVIGYTDGTVRPEGNILRGEVAAIFFRLLTEEARQKYLTTENSFEDIYEGQWYNTIISTLENMGIVTGYADGTFRADQPITRGEFAAMAARFDSGSAVSGELFSDIDGHWAEQYILKAAQKGWILGRPDGTFAPDLNITRAEAMTLINRVLKRLPASPDDLLEGMNKWPDNMDQNAWYYLAVQEATNTHDYSYHDDGVHESWDTMLEDPDWKQYEE